MDFKFVDQNSPYYRQAVDLRISLFLQNMENAAQLIQDSFESDSYHLVCIEENGSVCGTGRLSIVKNEDVISQMAISEKFQRLGVGMKIMNVLMAKCSELGLGKISLSARETALDFYKKFGFTTIGLLYPSKKTGVIHQNMSRVLSDNAMT